MAERHYQMTKIRAGDYLLPSNDGTRLFRLVAVEEDGTAQRQDDEGRWHPIVGTFWTVYRAMKPLDEISLDDALDPDRWDHQWDAVCSMLPSRKAAIQEALSK